MADEQITFGQQSPSLQQRWRSQGLGSASASQLAAASQRVWNSVLLRRLSTATKSTRSAASVTVVARQRPDKGYVADGRSRGLCGSAIAVAPSNGCVNKAHSGHLISDGKRTEALYVLGQVSCPESSAQVDLGITVDIRSVANLAVHDRDVARTFFEPPACSSWSGPRPSGHRQASEPPRDRGRARGSSSVASHRSTSAGTAFRSSARRRRGRRGWLGPPWTGIECPAEWPRAGHPQT